MKIFNRNLVSAMVLTAAAFSCVVVTTPVVAQSSNAIPEKHAGRKTLAIGPAVGKKVQQAYELYAADQPEQALEILLDIDAKKEYDRAYLDRFIGSIYFGIDGKTRLGLEYLKKAIAPDILNYVDQASTMKNVADLELQEQLYDDAIASYYAWIDFTGKQDPDVYVRIAQAYMSSKKLAEVVPAADKAIALYDKPNRNPYILKLSSFYERKLYPEAVAVAEDLVRFFPEDRRWWAQLGMFYMLIEDYPKALSTMELLHKQGFIEKENEAKTLSQLYATSNIPYKSAVIQEEYIKKGLIKNDADAKKTLANAWHAAMELDKAAKYYGQAAAETNDPDLFRKQGSLLLQSEKYSQSVAPLKKALALGYDRPGSVHMSLAEAYFYQENFKDAYASIQEAMKDPSTKRVARSWSSYIKDTAKRKGKSI